MQSKATTVAAYLASLPPDRRGAIEAVRKVILRNLDKGYQETMQYGGIGYSVPHSTYPAGYHCDPRQPLPFAGLGSQKHYMSLGLMSLYGSPEDDRSFRAAWAKTGKKLDMGKVCIRFRRVEDLALDVIAEAVRRTPVKAYIAYYEKALLTMNKAAAARAEARKSGGGAGGGVKAARPKSAGAKPAARKPVKRRSAARA
ncbi:MAG: DUF1801 domain-containing protein [Phycisphaerales bacterium]